MGIGHAILRLQNVFGEGQSLRNPYTGILSIFSTRIRLRLPVPIFEDGEETRDFVHVGDVADALLACAESASPNGEPLNVGSGEATSVMKVATLLCRAMESDVVPHVTGEYRIGDIRHNFADISRLERLTGVRLKISLEGGLDRFCKWVVTQPIPKDMLEKANSELKARRMMG
jgi:dTDP-L-rhamnose 4-epimerase